MPARDGALLGRSRWRRLCLAATLAGLVVVVLTAVFHRPLLRGAARWWVVKSSVEQADVIAVGSNASDTVFRQALIWYREGRAPRIALLPSFTRPTDRIGITETTAERRVRELVKAGVPSDKFSLVGSELSTFHDSFCALREWSHSNQVRHILMPVSPFASRRGAWVARRILDPVKVQITVVAVAVPDYSVDEWWRTEAGLMGFENEAVLMADNWCRY